MSNRLLRLGSAWAVMFCCGSGCGEGSESAPQPDPQQNASPGGCTGAKCDVPTDSRDYSWDVACSQRRRDVLQGNRETYTPGAIRWSCGDVPGVNAKRGVDDRGQEYCEYFALVQWPKEAAVELGRIIGEAQNARLKRLAPVTTPLELVPTAEQLDWLDASGDDVVGHCVFTSWHEDAPKLGCERDGCDAVIGQVKTTKEIFGMKLPLNSNEAARDLLRECLDYTAQKAYSTATEDPRLADDFTRGCRLADDLFGTGWRFSDAAVCAAMMRLAECQCAPLSSSDELEALVDNLLPAVGTKGQLQGFPLGSWSTLGSLPSGCAYVEEELAGRTLVACDLYGSDVLDNQKDLKGLCQERYGQNVAVWVPLPGDSLSCDQSVARCQGTPWVVQSPPLP